MGQPRERGILSNTFDGILASALGTLMIYPFVRAKEMLSIHPDTPPQQKVERYMYALPQFIRERGAASLFTNYAKYAVRIPAITFDLVLFHSLKNILFSPRRIHPAEIPWIPSFLIAGSTAGIRYFLYEPVRIACEKAVLSESNVKDMAREVSNSLKNRYQNKGFKGLHSNLGLNLPVLMIARGFQLATIDASMESMKYDEGHTSLFRKFLLCFSITVLSRFFTFPLELARDKSFYDDKNHGKNTQKLFKNALTEVKTGGMDLFRRATGRAFVASSSAMSFALFYHFRDDAMKQRY